MTEQGTREYLVRLLSREIGRDTFLTLTSGQRARFLGWLERSGANVRALHGRVSQGFSIAQLLATEGCQPAPHVATRAREDVRRGPEGEETLAGGLAGIGIDIQRIAEVVPHGDAFDFRTSPELARLFTEREISYASARPSPRETLAGLFAAKEAIVKADAGKVREQWREIEVLPNESGAPAHAGFRLSIAHSGDYAVAMALRVGGAQERRPAAPAIARPATAEPAGRSAPARSRSVAWIAALSLGLVAAGMFCARLLHASGMW